MCLLPSAAAHAHACNCPLGSTTVWRHALLWRALWTTEGARLCTQAGALTHSETCRKVRQHACMGDVGVVAAFCLLSSCEWHHAVPQREHMVWRFRSATAKGFRDAWREAPPACAPVPSEVSMSSYRIRLSECRIALLHTLTRFMHAPEGPHRTCQVQNCGIDPSEGAAFGGVFPTSASVRSPSRYIHSTSATRHGARSCAVGPLDMRKSGISTVYERTCSARHSQCRCCCLSSRDLLSNAHRKRAPDQRGPHQHE